MDANSDLSDSAYEELDRHLEEAEEKGRKLAAKGRELTKSGQFIADLSRATRGVIEVYRPPTNVEILINDWSATNKALDDALAAVENVELYSVASTSGTAAYTSSDSYQAYIVLGVVSPSSRPLVRDRIHTLNEVIQRSLEVNEVRELLISFGFDQAPEGRKSPLELFNTAHNAFENPVEEGNPISTSLIPMRSAITSVIAELLRRRPKQEKAKNEWAKIQSIGKQLKRNSIPDSLVDTWAFQWNELLNKYLSPAKEQAIDRADWQHRLQQATLFLKNLLIGIDQAKLKS